MIVNAVDNSVAVDKQAMLKEKAAELVSNVFYGTLMKEFRAGSEDSLFSGGFAGQAFQQQLDSVYIDQLSRQTNNPIADALVRQLGGLKNQ